MIYLAINSAIKLSICFGFVFSFSIFRTFSFVTFVCLLKCYYTLSKCDEFVPLSHIEHFSKYH